MVSFENDEVEAVFSEPFLFLSQNLKITLIDLLWPQQPQKWKREFLPINNGNGLCFAVQFFLGFVQSSRWWFNWCDALKLSFFNLLWSYVLLWTTFLLNEEATYFDNLFPVKYRPCPLIQILWRFYPDFILILSKSYPNFIQIVSRFNTDFIQILSIFFRGSLYFRLSNFLFMPWSIWYIYIWNSNRIRMDPEFPDSDIFGSDICPSLEGHGIFGYILVISEKACHLD